MYEAYLVRVRVRVRVQKKGSLGNKRVNFYHYFLGEKIIFSKFGEYNKFTGNRCLALWPTQPL